MDTKSLFIQIPPQQIAYLTFLFESYEGLAVVRMVDRHRGIVEIMVPPCFEDEAKEIIQDLAQEFSVAALADKEQRGCSELNPKGGTDEIDQGQHDRSEGYRRRSTRAL